MNILQVCAYASTYEGNFITSLYALEKLLCKKGHNVYYAFPEKAKEMAWCKSLMKRTKVFFLPLKHARVFPKTYYKLRGIVKNEKVSIIHSHFELYDIACQFASSKSVNVFWHLHDPISKSSKLGRNLLNKMQYSAFSRRVTLLSVNEHYTEYVLAMGFKGRKAETVLNGINLKRISYPYGASGNKEYDFLTFGWDYYRKGVDLIFNALERLDKEGYSFSFLLNCNDRAKPTIIKRFNGEIPDWLIIGDPVEDINCLFSNAKTFIQASRRETFSYAVCEASYAGMDVLTSDIYGLEWAHSIPSVSFFESENENQLYSLLKKRLDCKCNISTEMINRSRQIIEENFSAEKWAERILNEYGIV